MKKRNYALLNILLAVLAIIFILIAVSVKHYLYILPGLLCIFIVLILRSKEIKKVNNDLNNTDSDQFLDPEESPDDRS